MLQDRFEAPTASVEEIFLKDLPEGVTLLPHSFDGETTRVALKFNVSSFAVKNKNFDLNGYIKKKLNITLTAFRHRKNIKELHLTRRLRMVIAPDNGQENTQICLYIEYTKE